MTYSCSSVQSFSAESNQNEGQFQQDHNKPGARKKSPAKILCSKCYDPHEKLHDCQEQSSKNPHAVVHLRLFSKHVKDSQKCHQKSFDETNNKIGGQQVLTSRLPRSHLKDGATTKHAMPMQNINQTITRLPI